MGKIKVNIWSTSEKNFRMLLTHINVSGDMRFSKLMVFTCIKLKAAVEATVEAEVKIFHESHVKRDSIS